MLVTMKKRVIFLVAGLFLGMSVLMAQGVPEGVVGAFRKGNSQELSKYLGDKVDLTIVDKSASADKRKTGEAMAAFFSAHKVSGFQVHHQGKRDESGFFVGTLTTASGNFRVNCFFRKVQNKSVIHQIRIDKTNE